LKVYFISGLGADERVFKHIQLPGYCQAVHLNWIRPEKNESLKEYSLRMAQRINTKEPFALVGLSLGGMVAIEIAKELKPQKTVLISSIPRSSCMPWYYKFAGTLRLHKIIPIRFIKQLSSIKRLFTTETSEDKKMLRVMIKESDPTFIRWAFAAALKWRSEELPRNLHHIHGSADEILPIRFSKPDHVISKAGHMMILNRAKRINEILRQIFDQDPQSTS
jgi:surfactin synthase thioesterase subunit